jgi:hypothetical protein
MPPVPPSRRLICGLAALTACACGAANSPATGSTRATPPVVGPQTVGRAIPVGGPTRQVAVPPDGEAYFGVQTQWDVDSPAEYAQRLGRIPAVFGMSAAFPLTGEDRTKLDGAVEQIAVVHAKFFLTLEPQQGLQTVTAATARDLATTIAAWNTKGVDVFVRFGQEMNASWHVWGQKPLEYVSAFRIVADAVHIYAPNAVMVWSPNYGGGYPFLGQQYLAQPGTADFNILDRDHDGKLTEADDPYAPYYPGDAYVDWVGITGYFPTSGPETFASLYDWTLPRRKRRRHRCPRLLRHLRRRPSQADGSLGNLSAVQRRASGTRRQQCGDQDRLDPPGSRPELRHPVPTSQNGELVRVREVGGRHHRRHRLACHRGSSGSRNTARGTDLAFPPGVLRRPAHRTRGVERRGFEPLTSAVRGQRSPS